MAGDTSSGGPAFHESPRRSGTRDRRIAGLTVVLLVGFVGVAVAKPWGAPGEPASSGGLQRTDAPSPAASVHGAAPAAPGVVPPADAVALPVAFTTTPPPSSSTWTGLRWRRLAPDDPLSLVTTVRRWAGGFIAVGSIAVPPSTPVWTSADGQAWEPLPFETPTTFWRGLAVLGVAEVGTSLVAITETVEYCGEPCELTFELPIVSWTSPDGRTWTRHILPPEWLASPPGRRPLFASGPAGMIVASTGPAARLATSGDGSEWRLLAADGFPARFALDDLRGTATGYIAIGRWTSGTRGDVATLWSADGRHWPRTPTLLPPSTRPTADAGAAAASLIVGRAGLIAVAGSGTASGATPWWHSQDGRHWEALPLFPPLGLASCSGEGCGPRPAGTLVGDGQRLVAIGGGAAARAWTSSDGREWTELAMSGEMPGDGAQDATLLLGGVLLSDGTTTWYGAAIAEP